MSIAVARGPEVDHLQADPAWAAKWADLWASCTFATPFLHIDAIAAWRARSTAACVLAYELDADGELVGAFPIVEDGKRWVGWGGAYALRHGWLARPLRGSFFAERAVVEIHRRMPEATVHLDDLPDVAPTDWTGRRRPAGRIVRVESTEESRIDLDGDEVSKPLDKRANSAQLSALRKLGKIEREDNLDAAGLEAAFEWWDRHARATSRPQRYDEDRRDFLRRIADRLTVSALFLKPQKKGSERRMISAFVGHAHGAHLDVECLAEAPDFEQWSAAYLHWLMLEPEVYARGVRHVGLKGMPQWLGWLGAPSPRVHVRLLGPTHQRVRHDAKDRFLGLSQWALARLER
ncbi:MAG: hypothetical protein RMA76_39015 [Deltaproteobacteria bacterium]|jgi:CelD/BcsL family acetyltransferase involved in cellulose biosynthesis